MPWSRSRILAVFDKWSRHTRQKMSHAELSHDRGEHCLKYITKYNIMILNMHVSKWINKKK